MIAMKAAPFIKHKFKLNVTHAYCRKYSYTTHNASKHKADPFYMHIC